MVKSQNLMLAAVILLISGILHLVWLGRPNSVVFDEVHDGKFINSYCCSGEHFFDIHPPHAKLLLAASAHLGGYDGSFEFKQIGDDFGETTVYALRIVPALSGIILNLLVFILLLQLGGSKPAAFLGALLLTFDNALLVQTRIMAMDGILLVAIAGSLSLLLAARSSKSKKRRYLFLLLCGGAAGLAVGTKFTGLTALALPAVIATATVIKRRSRTSLFNESRDYFIVIVGAAAVYLMGWYIHFALLSLPGPGDAFFRPTDHFLTNIFKLHEVMFRSNYFLEATHQDASKWWSWPLMSTPIYYWSGPNAGIYFLGNPVVWWGGSLAFLASLVLAVCQTLRRVTAAPSEINFLFWIPLAGFCIAFLPYVHVPRVLFMYHYLPPLFFSLLFTMLYLDGTGWIKKGGVGHQHWSYWCTVALLITGFLFFSPLTFGWKYANWYERLIFGTFPGWS